MKKFILSLILILCLTAQGWGADLPGRATYIVDPTQLDQGVQGNLQTIAAYLTSIGTTKNATLYFRHTGLSDTTQYVVTTAVDFTTYPYIYLYFEQGAVLAGAGNVTLYSSMNVMKGPTQDIYDGTGTLAYYALDWYVGDLNTFTGSTIADDSTVKTALQALETAVESAAALDAELTALAGVTSAANAIPYFTGSETADVISSSANMVSLLGSADYSTARTNLGLAIGTNVQAYDADLTTFAALACTEGQIIVKNAGGDWACGASPAVSVDGLTEDVTDDSYLDKAAIALAAKSVSQSATDLADDGVLTPTAGYFVIDISITCAGDNNDIVMGETGAIEGAIAIITNTAANTCRFNDSAGVSELKTTTISLEQDDVLILKYHSSSWYEINRNQASLALASIAEAVPFADGDGTGTAQFAFATSAARIYTLPGDADQTIVTLDSSSTLTNKTFVTTATGNVLTMTGQIILPYPHLCAAGAPMQTTSTANTYGQCLFADDADKATNYAEYYLVVPADIDLNVDLTASFKIKLAAADTGDHEYEISFDSVADSAAYAGSLGDAISLAYTADASGAQNDVETAGPTTLTGWRAAMTAGQLFVIRVARDGDHANDGSTADSYSGPLIINYTKTQ